MSIYQYLLDNGIQVWLTGGWGIDALLGEQTRPHKDLDVIMLLDDVVRTRELLGRAAIARTIRHQIETAARDGALIYGTTYATAEVAPATVDFLCEEIRRVASDAGYESYYRVGTPPLALRIDRIGSTSVPGLGAKDVIDIQITVQELTPGVRQSQPDLSS